MSKFHVVLPARSDSVRLPRKLYALVHGKSVAQLTWERALQSSATTVTVAAKDKEIADHCRIFGARVFETSGEERNGTEAVAEATRDLHDSVIVVNVQMDDCLVPPEAINQCARLLTGHYQMGTLIAPIDPAADDHSRGRNVCKVVVNAKNEALYFSRSDLPSHKIQCLDRSVTRYAHMGVYAYTVGMLKRYLSLAPSYAEEVEGLEQLRPLYYGIPIICGKWSAPYLRGVDTVSDLERVRRVLAPKMATAA